MIASQAHAQIKFEYDPSPPVIFNGDTLIKAWSGGISHPHITQFDIDGDGLQDLLMVDRIGEKPLVFLRKNVGNSFIYEYDFELSKVMPPLFSFVTAVDYNCDNKPDIFTGNGAAGIMVWRNESTPGNVHFVQGIPLSFLMSKQGALFSSLHNNPLAAPIIRDIDGDGKLDIINQSVFQTTLEHHRNNVTCGLDFEMIEQCWGNFTKNDVWKTNNLGFCQNNLQGSQDSTVVSKTLHLGAMHFDLIDYNGNGKLDILIGEEEQDGITAMYASPSSTFQNFISQDTTYPAGSPISMRYHLSPQFIDIDQDGKLDLTIAPRENIGVGSRSFWFYKNTSTANTPNFVLQQKDYMQDEMINLGHGAFPLFADINGDGKVDLIAGNRGNIVDSAVFRAQLYYFQNTGTASSPAFTLVDTNFANTFSYNREYLFPALADMDDDGDLDFILGNRDGTLTYVQNIGSAQIPSWATPVHNYQAIDVGNYAAPAAHDVDEDGLIDLVIGHSMGTLSYYRNTGTATQAQFTLVSSEFGGVDTRSVFSFFGYSTPAFLEVKGRSLLAVGGNITGVTLYDSLAATATAPSQINGNIGNGSQQIIDPDITFTGTSRRTSRNQILIRAQELKQAGLIAGRIFRLEYQVYTTNNPFVSNGLSVGMKNVQDSVVTGFETGFTQVHWANVLPSQGWNSLHFPNGFVWDGSSNLLIEFCFSQNFPNNNIGLVMHSTPFASNAYGDITNWNLITRNGCEMPFAAVSTLRPNFKIHIKPGFLPKGEKVKQGTWNAATFFDFDADGYPEMVAGNESGGLQFFKGAEEDSTNIGIKEFVVKNKQALTLYPNPAQDYVTVLLSSDIAHDAQIIEIVSMSGSRLIVHNKINKGSNKVELPTHSLSAGVYLVRVLYQNQNPEVARLVITR